MDLKRNILLTFVGVFATVVQAHPLEREKRFLTPTTYPVPTKPQGPVKGPVIFDYQTVLTGPNIIHNSRPVNCPVKRSTHKKRIVLDQRLMKEIYLELAGDFDKSVVAETLEDAEKNFIHLPAGAMANSRDQEQTPIIKSVLMDDILKFNKWYENTLNSMNNDHSPALADKNGNRINETLHALLEVLDITNEQLKHILGIQNDMDLVTRYLPVDERRKRAVSASGSTSIQQYCVQRGKSTGNGYLHMCTTCAMTVQLPEDRYPRVMNQADCDSQDCNCFFTNGASHGKCMPVVFHIKMLKRNGCRSMIQNGTQLIFDNWELYDQEVRTGCECYFNKQSQYAPFVG